MDGTVPILYAACLVSVMVVITWLCFFFMCSSRRAALAQRQQLAHAQVQVRAQVQAQAHYTSQATSKGKGWFEVACKPSESSSFAIGVADRVSVVVLNP